MRTLGHSSLLLGAALLAILAAGCNAIVGNGTAHLSEGAGQGGGLLGSAGTTGAAGSSAPTPNCPGIEVGTACTVVPQCGCAEGTTCVPTTASGSGKCVPTGKGKMGDHCTANTDCAPGLGCANLWKDVEEIHVCGPNTATSTYSCGGFSSPLLVDGTTTAVTGRSICLVSCDPVHPQNPSSPYDNACGANVGCAYVATGQIQNTVCAYPPGTKPAGATCTSGRECMPGMDCVYQADVGKCRSLCRSQTDCPPNATCPITGLDHGFCEVGAQEGVTF